MSAASRPEPVVGAYIFDKRGRLLLIRTPKLDNKWMVPGGHIERGEHVLDAAKREAYEETGLRVRPLGVVAVAESVSATSGKFSRRHFIYFETVCRAVSSRVRIDNVEATAYKWFDIGDALSAMEYPVVRRVIREYAEQRARGRVRYIEVLHQKNAKL